MRCCSGYAWLAVLIVTALVLQNGGYYPAADMTAVGVGIGFAPPPLHDHSRRRKDQPTAPAPVINHVISPTAANAGGRAPPLSAASGAVTVVEAGWPNVTQSFEDDDHMYGLLPPFRRPVETPLSNRESAREH